MLKPAFITFTGADDETDPAELQALCADYPVEIGILLSRTREGSERYPSRGWISDLAGRGIPLAAHICGGWAKDVVEGRDPALPAGILSIFGRAQINVAPGADPAVVSAWAGRTSGTDGLPVAPILQCRGDAFPDDERVSWLYDTSGGNGTEPSSWPAPGRSGVRFGYAGGMGPDNVRRILDAIPHAEGVWIDMETRVRNDRDEFDVGLCRKVCREVYGDRR